jgi:hypothetical protein
VNRILVVTAIDVEARTLARHLGLARVPGHGPPLFRGSKFDVACAGPGATQITRLAPLARTAGLVVSAGTCGALAPELEVGDLVLPAAVVGPDGRRHGLATLPGLEPRGTLLTVRGVVETAEAKAILWRKTAALAVDMESLVIVEWAAALGLPALVARGVVDTAARGIPAAFAGMVDGHGRTRVGRAIRVVLTRPRSLSDALTLGRGTARALRRVAHTLLSLPDAARNAPAPEGSSGSAPAGPAPEGTSGRRVERRHATGGGPRGDAMPGLPTGGGYRGGAADAPPDS